MVTAVVTDQDQPSLLHTCDQSRNKLKESRRADETHEVVVLGDSDSLLDGDGSSATVGDHAWILVLFGCWCYAELVTEKDRVCAKISVCSRTKDCWHLQFGCFQFRAVQMSAL